MEFLTSTYEAAASAGNWDRAALETPLGVRAYRAKSNESAKRDGEAFAPVSQILEEMQTKRLIGVGPGLDGVPAPGARERLELGDRVFVRILGVDALTLGEGEAAAQDVYGLVGKAHEIHFHTAGLPIPYRVMGEAGEIERGPKLAIDAVQQIQIEGGSDALVHRYRPAKG